MVFFKSATKNEFVVTKPNVVTDCLLNQPFLWLVRTVLNELFSTVWTTKLTKMNHVVSLNERCCHIADEQVFFSSVRDHKQNGLFLRCCVFKVRFSLNLVNFNGYRDDGGCQHRCIKAPGRCEGQTSRTGVRIIRRWDEDYFRAYSVISCNHIINNRKCMGVYICLICGTWNGGCLFYFAIW